MKKSCDLIIIGSGSIGVPAAKVFAENKYSVLILDSLASPGQGQNKTAIGGIRATHSDQGKISVCQRSIEIFSQWKEDYGDDIQWQENGYSFPAYTAEDERLLQDLMKIQKGFGLNITWLSPDEYRELNPGIAMKGLRGSTYSPEDGSASPLLFTQSCYLEAVEHGAAFLFNEIVTGFHIDHNKINAVKTNKGVYHSACVLNAAGTNARAVSQLAGIDIPVNPDSHEAGITEPVKQFMGPMVVDIRKQPGSSNFYFYQNSEGQVFFCIASDPPIWEIDSRSTSVFLPMVAKRMVQVMPLLANLKVRRTWRGQFPRTPDDCPIVGRTKEITNFYQAVGMGGRGFMLGPGMAELLFRIIHEDQRQSDTQLLKAFSPYRDSFWGEIER